ncbi:MAG TPA: hypothetical protein VLE97_07200 [Gaiellaceae bacterium]|nr:hypothetical protein [Gaiellaceae bacterium]
MAKSAPRKKVTLPRYDEKRGWTGGDNRTLYAFTDRRTGAVNVHPGGGSGKKLTMHWGPEADVRVATRPEAEIHWQNPLHAGWKVDDGPAHATKKRGKDEPRIAYWIRTRGGPRSSWDVVPVYVLGTTTRADEGIVGHDLRVRPLRLGKGSYTMVVSPDDVEDEP